MKIIISLVKRNLKLFFRDRTSVFFSLLAVFIIIGLFVLFLGNLMAKDLQDLFGEYARFTINSWVMAGILAVTSITTTMGAFGIMIEDKTKKISKDFFSAPLKRSQLVGGYICSTFIIGLIMSIAALVIAEVYILADGGSLLGYLEILKLIGVMLLSVFASSSIVLFIVTFFRSSNGFAAASTIIGTLIGFLTGIYIPIGSLPQTVQTAIKIFPISHAAALFRQIMMKEPLSAAFRNIPAEAILDFKKTMGVVFYFGDREVTPLMNILILAATGILFYLLAIWRVSVKKKY